MEKKQVAFEEEVKEVKISWWEVVRHLDIDPEKVVDIDLMGDEMGEWLAISYIE